MSKYIRLFNFHSMGGWRFNLIPCFIVCGLLLSSFKIHASPLVSRSDLYTNIKVMGIRGFIYEVKELQGDIWVRTDLGVWRVKKGEQGVKVIEYSHQKTKSTLEKVRLAESEQILTFQGNVWIGTSQGLWRFNKGEQGVKAVGGAIRYIKELQGDVWVGSSHGVWRFKEGAQGVKVAEGISTGFPGLSMSGGIAGFGEIHRFQEIKVLQGDVWVGTSQGVWRFKKGGQGVKVADGHFNRIFELQGAVWVWTTEGAWRFKNRVQGVKIAEGQIFDIQEYKEDVWIETSEGIWRVKKEDERGVKVAEGSIEIIKKLQDDFWLITSLGVWRFKNGEKGAKIATYFLQELTPSDIFRDKPSLGIKELQGAVWIWVSQGMWRFKNEELEVKQVEGHINEIKDLQGDVWVGSSHGVWRFEDGGQGGKVIERSIKTPGILSIYELIEQHQEIKVQQGDVWIGTDEGAWRFKKGEQGIKLVEGSIREIKELQGDIWVGTSEGAWRFKKGEQGIKLAEGSIREIKELQGDIWVGTSEGAWRFKKGEQGIKLAEGSIREIKELQGDIWVSTSQELWRFKTREQGVRVVEDFTKEINEIQGDVWVETSQEVWRFKKEAQGVKVVEGSIKAIWGVKKGEQGINFVARSIKNIEEHQEDIWVETDEGVWWVKKDGQGVKVAEGSIKNIKEFQGDIWIGTSKGAWLIKNGKQGVKVLEGNVQEIWKLQGDLSVLTSNALYKIYPFKVTVTTITASIFSWMETILPGLWVSGDRTLSIKLLDPDSGKLIYDFANHPFEPESFWSIKDGEKNRGYPTARLEVKEFGYKSIIYDINDDWFNHFRNKTDELRAFVIPGLALWPFLIAGFSLILFIVLYMISPWCLFAHNILMNPMMRKSGYFGLFPLIISLSRGHIMRRYIRQMNRELNDNSLIKNYVDHSGSFEPHQFVKSHIHASSFLIYGDSGIGKSAFIYRMVDIIINTKLYKKKWIPIILPSISFQTSSLEDAIVNEFQRLGQITDRELIIWLLIQGGFCLFIDGLNEVTEDQITVVVNKSRSLSGTNAIFFTSQQKHKELINTVEISMHGFEEKEINEFLIKTLGEKKGNLIFQSFTEQMLLFLSIPQNLTTLVQVINEEENWQGTTEVDLYRSFFDNIFSAWQHTGADDDKRNLLKIAEESWKERKPKFSVDILTENALRDLFEFRVLVHRGKESSFSHDRLRAYLVSLVLSSQWRKETFESLDSNWIVSLQMLSDGFTAEDEAKTLCEKVLDENIDIAVELFRHINSQKPDLVMSWKKSFYENLGQKRVEG